MCLFRRKKKEIDELEEYENNATQSNYYDYDDKTKSDACFITKGDIFVIRDQIIVMGVAIKEINVGDTIQVGTRDVQVRNIEVFRKLADKLNPGENGALAIGKDPSLKQYILSLTKEHSAYNEPVNLDGKPTQEYTYFYKK